MSWLNRRALYVLGAVTLVASALAIAADEPGPASKVEVSTVGSGPATLTPVEVEKLREVEEARVAPSEVAGVSEASEASNEGSGQEPVAEKAPEISTIVVGTSGLTAQELAKLQPQATDEQE